MSFILDALKKSEIERQRQSAPGLMETGAPPRRSRFPLWAVLLTALLGVNIVVLMVLLKERGAPAAAAPPAIVARVPDDKPAAVPDHFSPLGQAPVYAPEIPVPPAPAASPDGAAGRPSVQHPAAHAGPRRTDPLLSDADAKDDNVELLPSINEVNLTGAQALPELHLDVHVFATKPADRFVYINMRKYHEGSVLQEGPIVERIRRDGVVLSYQGLRFVLPRQS
jgi:general secretion pathway protein B